MAVRIGYLLPTRESVMEGRHAAAPLLKLAETAEDLGYDSVWVGDSLLARPRHEPLTLLAGVAGRTTNIALGTAILLPALRNPVVMAHQISTLDQISDGRTIIGVGIATDQENIRNEFMAAGVPFEKRVGRMLEGLRLCRALWSGEAVDWNGRWTVKQGILGPMPVQKNGPPIWIGGGADHASSSEPIPRPCSEQIRHVFLVQLMYVRLFCGDSTGWCAVLTCCSALCSCWLWWSF